MSPSTLPSSRGDSLATDVATKMRAEIMRLGWPAGHHLGAEAQLIERYGVSRAVLREAIAMLERTGTVAVRRGVNGGIVVDRRADAALVRTIAAYLDYAGVELTELLDARHALETRATRLAAQRWRGDDVTALRALPHHFDPRDSGFAFHVEIGRRSHNGVLAIFNEALLEATTARLRELDDVPRELLDDADHDHDVIIDAIERRDHERAESLMARHLDETAEWMARFAASTPVLTRRRRPLRLARPVHGVKRHEQLARRITHEIRVRGLAPGTLLGSETALLAELGVSRGAFREAARSLASYGILELRRGPNGGIFVGTPDPSTVIDDAVRCLDFLDIRADLRDAREAIELRNTDLAARRCGPDDAAALQAAVRTERDAVARLARRHQLGDPTASHLAIAGATDNRALALLTSIVLALQSEHDASSLTVQGREQLLSRLVDRHQRIVDLIARHDGDAAQNELRAHDRAVARLGSASKRANGD